ncbi:MAG: amidase family protein, partial [Pseudolabrys sp.]
KPSWGGIATEGAMALAPSLDTIGLMARSAVDIAEVWPAVTLRSGEASAIRSAAVRTDAFAAADSQGARACREAAADFSGLGLSVSDAGGFPEDADVQALIVMQAEAARVHRGRFADERIDPVLRKRLSKGLGIGDAELAAALARRSILLEAFLGQLGGADVALLPVMPIVTPEVAEVDPSSPRFSGKTLYAMSRFTRFANYLGLPVLAVPPGFDDRGMPLALQIVGRPGSEASLIALGVAFQSRTAWHGIVPAAIRSDIAAEEGSYQ